MTQYSSVGSKYKSKQDSGSTEAQISFLTRRVVQLSFHLKTHKKDHSSKKGLRQILGKRKRLLAYLSREDVSRYNRLISYLGIRAEKKRKIGA